MSNYAAYRIPDTETPLWTDSDLGVMQGQLCDLSSADGEAHEVFWVWDLEEDTPVALVFQGDLYRRVEG